MNDLQTQLEEHLRGAVVSAFGDDYADVDPLITPAKDPKFGDYQANVAMGLAKRIGAKPRDVAEKIRDAVPEGGLIESGNVAGPGFINVVLSSHAMEEHLAAMAADDRLGVGVVEPAQNVVVDYSGPNVAKEMHVGHLRSTIIGDAIARVLAFQGHGVIRQNHMGDWGTQFGMLIEHLVDNGARPGAALDADIPDLNVFYQQAKGRFDAEPDFADRARQRVVRLQGGDGDTNRFWKQLVSLSQMHFREAYDRLGVLLEDGDTRGESRYNDDLAGIVAGLEASGLLRESHGASVVYPDGFTDRDDEPMPMIVRKTDGGYLYATTDLAAARYRIVELGADRIIYVTDARQAQHFAMVFQTLRQAGWTGEGLRLDHVSFGTILGRDRKPFKTREGGTVKLADVLDGAEERALGVIRDKGIVTDPREQARMAHVIGIGAVKYADLSNDRIRDYVFDWDRMLALEGNTAPYLQNAYMRVRAIFRKAQTPGDPPGEIRIAAPSERALALHLLRLSRVIDAVADSLEPHRLCTYLYELATHFHRFYEHCPVLKADDEPTRDSRLALSGLVARTLKKGLELLGIETVERM